MAGSKEWIPPIKGNQIRLQFTHPPCYPQPRKRVNRTQQTLRWYLLRHCLALVVLSRSGKKQRWIEQRVVNKVYAKMRLQRLVEMRHKKRVAATIRIGGTDKNDGFLRGLGHIFLNVATTIYKNRKKRQGFTKNPAAFFYTFSEERRLCVTFSATLLVIFGHFFLDRFRYLSIFHKFH